MKEEDTKTYSDEQLEEIKKGKEAGLQTEIYENPEFLPIQMMQIRLGLEEGLPVEKYATITCDWFQMEEIREGLKEGIDLSSYKTYPPGILYQLRMAHADGIDLTAYLYEGYDKEQLREIREALKQNLPIKDWIDTSLRAAFIHEIALALKENLNLSLYLDKQMNWQQMREIRLGLEHRVDISLYRNVLYAPGQMREIRLGLEEGIPVDDYASFMYTAREMKLRRELFKKHREELLELSLQTGEDVEEIKVREPENGKDGYYEFFFDMSDLAEIISSECREKIKKRYKKGLRVKRDHENLEKILNHEGFKAVKKGDVLAVYHEATMGRAGVAKDGSAILGTKGKELPPLEGTSFTLLEDGKTYVAAKDGVVEYKENRIEITNLLVLDEVTSLKENMRFDGFIHVLTDVKDGAYLYAERDILIDGFVEDAVIEAKGNIYVREGINAGTFAKGSIKAGGSVITSFFERTVVYAGNMIKAGYSLNSSLRAEYAVEMDETFGRIIGGCVTAGDYVSAYEIGNEKENLTSVTVGKLNECLAEDRKLNAQMYALKEEQKLLYASYQQFKKKFSPEVRNANPLFSKLESAIYTKKLEEEELRKKQTELKLKEIRSRRAHITVNGILYSGVTIRINDVLMHPEQLECVTLKQSGKNIAVNKN